ncbi:MAG: extracellular solute-binding protein [Candidatus Cohnella colombiensis]|uniref:Extracellular solute-binding protein n=1 Tax=Candidatus Cohnella colombiensis TaxID=3121368 RepID=A0AA95EXG7_9BACL|nr:MAG: extracellular solute-binding protein [Cohnella sp.]
MKQTRKLLLLALALVFAFTLAACGGSSKNNDSSPSVSSTTPSESSVEPSPSPDEPSASSDEMEFDLGGRTITIAAWWDATPAGNTPAEQQILQNIQDLQKKFNFTLKYENVAYDQIAEKTISSVLAGQPFADIVRLARGMSFPGMVTKDILLPLDDILTASGTDKETFLSPFNTTASTFGGKLYGWGDNPYFDYSGIVYNRTLLQKLGMTDLATYVKDGTWTWDKFKEIANQATQGDSFGFVDFTSDFLDFALASNGVDLVDLAANKQSLDNPKVLESMQFTQDVMNAKFFPPGTRSDWQYPGAAFRKGNVLMYAAFNWMTQSVKQDMGDVDIGFVPFPKGKSEDKFVTNATDPSYYVIPKGVKDPEKVMYIYRKIYDVPPSEEYPGQDKLEATFTNQDDIDSAIEASKHLKVMDYKLLMSIYSGDFYAMVDELTNGEASPASAVEARKEIFQKALDDTFGS